LSIILTVIIFGIIVIIHEFGHFIAAVKSGVYVEEFAIGMGPKIFGIKKGDILYSIRLFPIGGFCKMAEEDNDEIDKKGFNSVSLYKRMIIVLAGVFMNFLLAFVISTLLVMFNGINEPVVAEISEGYSAQKADMHIGDRIIKYNGKKIHIYDELRFYLNTYSGGDIKISIERDGKILDKIVTPTKNEYGAYIIGFSLNPKSPFLKEKIEGMEKAGFFESCKNGFWSMVCMVKVTFYGLKQIFTMNVSIDEMAGPIGLTAVVGDVYEQTKENIWYTIQSMASLVALLSANLGVMNILPIPALDGGRFIFLFAEMIRRKPLPPEKEGVVHLVGFVILMIFGIAVAFNDILKFI